MRKDEKEQLVSDLHQRLEKAQGTFIVHYQGLKVEEINRLRNELRDKGTEFQVVKNRLLRLASQGTGTELIKDHMQGPTAIAFTYDDVIGPAKTLIDFAKGFAQLEIKGGQISGREVSAEAIKKLATLPGREVLLSHVLAAIQAVPANFVRLMGGLISQLLYALKAIEQQKQA